MEDLKGFMDRMGEAYIARDAAMLDAVFAEVPRPRVSATDDGVRFDATPAWVAMVVVLLERSPMVPVAVQSALRTWFTTGLGEPGGPVRGMGDLVRRAAALESVTKETMGRILLDVELVEVEQAVSVDGEVRVAWSMPEVLVQIAVAMVIQAMPPELGNQVAAWAAQKWPAEADGEAGEDGDA